MVTLRKQIPEKSLFIVESLSYIYKVTKRNIIMKDEKNLRNHESRFAAIKVLKEINKNNTLIIHGRYNLDRCIEIIKFGKNRKINNSGWSGPTLAEFHKEHLNKTAFKNQQYDPIRKWIIANGFLEQIKIKNKYHYIVTDKLKSFRNNPISLYYYKNNQ